MKTNQLIPSISTMSYEEVLAKVQAARNARELETENSSQKRVKRERKKKTELEKLLAKLSPADRKALMAGLEDG